MCRRLFSANRRQQYAEGGRGYREFLRSQTVRRPDLDLNEPAVVLDTTNPAIAHQYPRLLALYKALHV